MSYRIFFCAHKRDTPSVKHAIAHFLHHPLELYTLSLGGKLGLESNSNILDFLSEKGG